MQLTDWKEDEITSESFAGPIPCDNRTFRRKGVDNGTSVSLGTPSILDDGPRLPYSTVRKHSLQCPDVASNIAHSLCPEATKI
mmetsp:Transcript_49714/g.55405  ORF Transcript_49714/g.55405 Transcript_49714/m.55405 type:complete len:83 (-) Transcript_49714:1867-2115(-)